MSGKEYRTITDVKGPLVFLNKTEPVAYGEIVQLRLSDGTMKNGQVLDTSDDQVIVHETLFDEIVSLQRRVRARHGDDFRVLGEQVLRTIALRTKQFKRATFVERGEHRL